MYLELNDLLTIINLMNLMSEKDGLTTEETELGIKLVNEANILLGSAEGERVH